MSFRFSPCSPCCYDYYGCVVEYVILMHIKARRDMGFPGGDTSVDFKINDIELDNFTCTEGVNYKKFFVTNNDIDLKPAIIDPNELQSPYFQEFFDGSPGVEKLLINKSDFNTNDVSYIDSDGVVHTENNRFTCRVDRSYSAPQDPNYNAWPFIGITVAAFLVFGLYGVSKDKNGNWQFCNNFGFPEYSNFYYKVFYVGGSLDFSGTFSPIFTIPRQALAKNY